MELNSELLERFVCRSSDINSLLSKNSKSILSIYKEKFSDSSKTLHTALKIHVKQKMEFNDPKPWKESKLTVRSFFQFMTLSEVNFHRVNYSNFKKKNYHC